jgi:hypothetical protein
MNEQALLRMLAQETTDRLTAHRRRHAERRVLRRKPVPARTDRRVF